MEGATQDERRDERAVTTVSSFAVAAHELKAPLSLVRQLALQLESGVIGAADVQRIAHQITLTSERGLRLTTDITKYTRLEDSLFTLEPLNPQVICQEVAEELTPLYKAHGRRLTVKTRNAAPLGLAHPDLLRRILLNFTDNALHYSDKDQPVTLMTSVIRGGSAIRVGVRDFGPALPPAVRKNVGAQTVPLHSRPGSSGMGLFIARQFAQAMQAHVGVINHRDGATFYVDISISQQLRLL